MSNFKEFDAQIANLAKIANTSVTNRDSIPFVFTNIATFARDNGIISQDELAEFIARRNEFIEASKQLSEKLLHYHLMATLKHWQRNKLKELEEAI
jgi:hypothetical protein